MSLAETARDLGSALGGLAGLGLGVKVAIDRVTSWLGKREDRLGVEAQAGADRSREDDITARHALRNEQELVRLVRVLTQQLSDVQSELGVVKGQLGTALANFKNCEERSDEQDGVIVRLMSRIEVLEKQSTPPPIAAE